MFVFNTDVFILGRLAFNIFQPKSLVCTINRIENRLHERCDDDSNATTTTIISNEENNNAGTDGCVKLTYDLFMDITIHTPDNADEDLKANIEMRAECQTKTDTRLSVKFTG